MLSFSLGILAYNEAQNLPSIINVLMRTLGGFPELDFTVVIIDNGSTDNTQEVVENLETEHGRLSHLRISENCGYGNGVIHGLNTLRGDVIGFMWGDNQFDPSIIKNMLDIFLKNSDIQLIKTYRVKRYDGAYRLFLSGLYQKIFKILYGGNIRDVNSGPKLFRFSFFQQRIVPLHSKDWFVDAEIMVKAITTLSADQIAEIPIDFFPRKYGKTNVRLSTCLEFLTNLFRYRFNKDYLKK